MGRSIVDFINPFPFCLVEDNRFTSLEIVFDQRKKCWLRVCLQVSDWSVIEQQTRIRSKRIIRKMYGAYLCFFCCWQKVSVFISHIFNPFLAKKRLCWKRMKTDARRSSLGWAFHKDTTNHLESLLDALWKQRSPMTSFSCIWILFVRDYCVPSLGHGWGLKADKCCFVILPETSWQLNISGVNFLNKGDIVVNFRFFSRNSVIFII